MGVKLVTDSASDLSSAYVEANKDIVRVAPCYIDLGSKSMIDDFGVTYDIKQFYTDIRAGIKPRTSMITPNRFYSLFAELVEQGDEIVYVGFSSQLSGTHNSAILASMQIKNEYPEARIHIVDTTCASIGLAVIFDEALKMVRADKSGEEIASHLESIKLRINHWFGVDSLKFLKEGGRITPMVAMIGTALNIKPTLTVDRTGRIVPAGKVRGRKKSIETLADKAINRYNEEYGSVIIVGHGDSEEDAKELEKLVRDRFPEAEIKLMCMHITIATHVGPGTLAVAFLGKEREE